MKRFLLSTVVFIVMCSAAGALEAPKPGKRDTRLTSITYRPDDVTRIDATYGISTMIVFDEDESFVDIGLGDTDSWYVVPNERKNILFIKPIAKDVVTNLNVVTTKRIYFLELHDFAPDAGKKVYGVRFIYPDKDLNASLRSEAEARAAHPNMNGIDKANVNLDYSFSGSSALKPSMIFDDGKKTYFKFKGTVPAIFAVNSNFSETLKNFRKEGEYIVVDGVGTQFTLRDGDQWTCIFNLRKPDFGAPDQDIMAPKFETQASIRSRSGNK
jgi:type IV secretion system protein VirB9